MSKGKAALARLVTRHLTSPQSYSKEPELANCEQYHSQVGKVRNHHIHCCVSQFCCRVYNGIAYLSIELGASDAEVNHVCVLSRELVFLFLASMRDRQREISREKWTRQKREKKRYGDPPTYFSGPTVKTNLLSLSSFSHLTTGGLFLLAQKSRCIALQP